VQFLYNRIAKVRLLTSPDGPPSILVFRRRSLKERWNEGFTAPLYPRRVLQIGNLGQIGPVRFRNNAFQQLIRFTGGEPTLQWTGIPEVIAQLRAAIDQPRPPILIQINGIEIGKGNLKSDSLKEDHDQRFLFELFLKVRQNPDTAPFPTYFLRNCPVRESANRNSLTDLTNNCAGYFPPSP
jgi:hypothetical protein